MMGHKICFYGEILLIICKLSLYPFLSGALVTVINRSEPENLREALQCPQRIPKVFPMLMKHLISKNLKLT